MSLANYCNFTLQYYNGSTWTDSYNSVQLRDITDNTNFPSFTSFLTPEIISQPTLKKLAGRNINIDSGGLWYRYTFEFNARNQNGLDCLRGIIDKSQSMNAAEPYFRLYQDIVNKPSIYIDVHYAGFTNYGVIEDSVRSGVFNFEATTKQTVWTEL